MKKINFPINPFEDVKPSEFNKLNKKNVTEDFVEENFNNMGWNVCRPFHDTGIDRIISKVVCPRGHTGLNESIEKYDCPICNEKCIEIKRFIQVKTRQLKNNIFGFTLKSKDIRIDPRHIFLLYSDQTTENTQDFLIVSNYHFFKFMLDNGFRPFSSISFRKGNNKLNSLKYDLKSDEWLWGRYSFEKFRNNEGLKLLQDPYIDLNLNKIIETTKEYANQLVKSYSGKTENETINNIVNTNLKLYKNDSSLIVKLRNKVKTYIKNKCENETYLSMEKYFEGIIRNSIVDTNEN